MSWLFGKKKNHKESPTDSTEEEQTVEQGSDFIFVERKENIISPIIPGSGTSNSLYPNMSGMPAYPPSMPHAPPKPDVDHIPYLSGVPFKLCKQLERSLNDDFDIDLLRVNEICSFIERTQSKNYNYNFEFEESIASEMTSRTNE
ncbi:uncharacterized protein [Prorops nasuta]|uniref:uncharacterized protein n=1 Tax=Prorops nasuta TaxID=863751 RepID=UPI0034CE3868